MLNYGGTLGKTSTASKTTGCVSAVAPTVLQATETVLPGAGATAVQLFDQTGLLPIEYVEVQVEGCNDVKFTINYLDGADCDDCTVDTPLTKVPVEIVVKANEGKVFPSGQIADIEFVTLDTAGAAANVVKNTTVDYYAVSANNPCCSTEVVA